MKKLFALAAITLTGTLIAAQAHSQVYVNAHIGFRVPGARVYVSTPPPPPPTTVVYQQYPAPAPPPPVYQDPYQDPYNGGACAQPTTTVVYETEFPGYAYYNYPVWNGHYRDRVYYEHYRPYFNRDYRPYFHRGRFDHVRYERDYRGHRGWERHGRGRW